MSKYRFPGRRLALIEAPRVHGTGPQKGEDSGADEPPRQAAYKCLHLVEVVSRHELHDPEKEIEDGHSEDNARHKGACSDAKVAMFFGSGLGEQVGGEQQCDETTT